MFQICPRMLYISRWTISLPASLVMEKGLYFAYGSNMDPRKLGDRVGAVRKVGNATLYHRRFLINARGVATVKIDHSSAYGASYGNWTPASSRCSIVTRVSETVCIGAKRLPSSMAKVLPGPCCMWRPKMNQGSQGRGIWS